MGCKRRLSLAATVIVLLSATSGCLVPEDMPALREELGYASVERPDLVVKARASTQTPTVDEPVELAAETDGLPLSAVDVTWTVNGTTYEDATIEVSFPEAGTYPVQVIAEGPNGTSAEDAIEIEARPNQAPVAEIDVAEGPLWADEPVAIRAEGSSDPDGDELSYEWRLDGEAVEAGPVLEGDLDAGAHEVAVTVSDGYAQDTARTTFAVDQRIAHEANLTIQEDEAQFTVPVADGLDEAELQLTHTTRAGLEQVSLIVRGPSGDAVASTQTDPEPGQNQATARLTLDGGDLGPEPHTLVVGLERGTQAMATIEGVFSYSPLPPAAG